MDVDEIVRRVRERSRRLASGLPVSVPPLGSDFSLSGVVPAPEIWRPAAVLVPLVRRAPGMTVLLTQRTDDIPRRFRPCLLHLVEQHGRGQFLHFVHWYKGCLQI